MPGSSNRQPQHNLFKVPSKKFIARDRAKFVWADNLEKIVKSYRGDAYINALFSKNKVKICEIHFNESDILLS